VKRDIRNIKTRSYATA